MKSHIFFKCTTDEVCDSGTWMLQSLIKPEYILELTNSDFPMGRRKWNLVEGNTFCKLDVENDIQLTFSACYPGKFTCGLGQCIPLEDHCNIELNCEDQTDELNCAGIRTGNEYAKEKMPVSVTAEPITIYINVSLLGFPSISTKDGKISVDFYLNLRWYDLRLNLWNLDHDFSINSLSKEELDALWKPELDFVNSLLSESYSIQPLKGVLIKENDPSKEDISLATECNTYCNCYQIEFYFNNVSYLLSSIFISWQ